MLTTMATFDSTKNVNSALHSAHLYVIRHKLSEEADEKKYSVT
jgi:hypothetical protein